LNCLGWWLSRLDRPRSLSVLRDQMLVASMALLDAISFHLS